MSIQGHLAGAHKSAVVLKEQKLEDPRMSEVKLNYALLFYMFPVLVTLDLDHGRGYVTTQFTLVGFLVVPRRRNPLPCQTPHLAMR